MTFFRVFLLSSLALGTLFAHSKTVSVTPQGLSERVSQVKVNFPTKMIPVGGDQLQKDAVAVVCTPEQQGAARWVNQKVWAYDFKSSKRGQATLPGATSCEIKFKAGIKDLTGAPVAIPKKKFLFAVDGPNLARVVRPSNWQLRSVAEDQAFLVELDTPATLASLEKNAYFSVQGIGSRIGVRVVQGAEKDQLLAAMFGTGDYGKKQAEKHRKDSRYQILRAKTNFPSGQAIALYFGKGIESEKGYKKQLVTRYKKQIGVRAPLRAQVQCSAYDDQSKKGVTCSPYSPISLTFSAKIPETALKDIVLRDLKSGKTWTPVYRLSDSKTAERLTFEAPFPAGGKVQLEVGSSVADDMGRALNNAQEFPKTIQITDIPSLVAFNSSFGILDANQKGNETFLPVTVRNVEPKLLVGEPSSAKGVSAQGATQKYGFAQFPQVVQWLKSVYQSSAGQKTALGAQKRSFQVPLIEKSPSGQLVPHQVVGIPLSGHGFFVTEIKSPKLAASQEEQKRQPTTYVRATTLVTNLSVHLKHGKEASALWVTDLKTGRPVPGAKVALADCKGDLQWQGSTSSKGLAIISKGLGEYIKNSCLDEENPWNASRYDKGFYALAQKGSDFTFTHSSWNRGITAWRFGVPATYEINIKNPSQNVVMHGIYDRPLYRAGEEVYVKFLARKKSSSGFQIPSKELAPDSIEVTDPIDGKKIYEGTMAWNAKEGEGLFIWKIPRDAVVGNYDVSLRNKKTNKYYYGGSLRVSDFKVPNMTGKLQLQAENPFPAKNVKADFMLGYSNGGPASEWPVQLSYTIEEIRRLNVKGYDWMEFARGPYQKGARPEPSKPKTQTQNLKLDKNGTGEYLISLSAFDPTRPYQVSSELIYRDSNGEVNTRYATEKIWASTHVIGLKGSDQPAKKKQIRFDLAVVNSDKKSAFQEVDAPEFSVYKEDTYSVSRRIPGGFYEQERHTVLTPVPAKVKCQKHPENELFQDCQMQVKKGGEYIVEASISKSGQLVSASNTKVYVSSNDPGDFSPELTKSDRIDLLPDKKEYNSGDLARFHLKTPYKLATALITVEREGVIETLVQPISRANPYFQLKVRDSWAPNVFVSAVVVRGRMGAGPKKVGAIDLNKPSFKMGLTQVKVNWNQNRLNIDVSTKGKKFKPREKVATKLVVKQAGTGKPVAGAKIVLALVDESLLQIRKNASWDVLDVMMQERALEVATSTGKLQIVGRRHFGLKATPHGGGGGLAPTRELFNTLAFWSDQIVTDKNGVAELEIPINSDSLTSFKVVAVGYKNADLFGKGSSSIKTAIDVMVQSGLPSVLRDQDTIEPDFTLRNTTKDKKSLTAQLEWTFTRNGQAGPKKREDRVIQVDANASARVRMTPVEIPVGMDKATYTLTLVDQDGKVVDRMRKSVPIYESVEVLPTMSVISQLTSGKPGEWDIQAPKEALPGRGQVYLSKSATLAGSITAFETYKKYSWQKDLESRLSVAVLSEDPQLWDRLLKDVSSGQYSDDKGLLKYHKTSRTGSAWLTSLYLIVLETVRVSVDPTVLAQWQQAVAQQFSEGRGAKKQNLAQLLRMSRALSLSGNLSESDLASLEKLDNGPAKWKLSEQLDWLLAYKNLGSAQYVGAKKITLKSLKDAMVLQGRSAVVEESSAIYFENDKGVQAAVIQWLMSEKAQIVGAKENLIVPLALGLVNGLKKSSGYWYLPSSNIWAYGALKSFSAHFEKDVIKGSTLFELQGNKVQKRVSRKAKDQFAFAWPNPSGVLKADHVGQGSPWVQITGEAAVALKSEVAAGFSVEKTLVKVEGSKGADFKIGDVYEVQYTIVPTSSVPSARLFVPVPSGASILSASMSGYSEFSEKTYRGYQAHLAYLRAGQSYTVTLKVRLNNSGTFKTPSARITATYTPEMRYVSPVGTWVVKP